MLCILRHLLISGKLCLVVQSKISFSSTSIFDSRYSEKQTNISIIKKKNLRKHGTSTNYQKKTESLPAREKKMCTLGYYQIEAVLNKYINVNVHCCKDNFLSLNF